MRKTSFNTFNTLKEICVGWCLNQPFLLLFFIICFSSCAVSNNFTPEKKYSPQQLKEDVQVLEQTLQRNHPSLYWYSSKTQVDAAFSRAYKLVNDSMNENGFKNLVCVILHNGIIILPEKRLQGFHSI
jgi:hypothetical protein